MRIGTVRALIGSSEVSARGVLCGLSMAVAICTGTGKTVSIGPDAGWYLFREAGIDSRLVGSSDRADRNQGSNGDKA